MVNQHNISLTLANVMVLRTDLNGQRAQSETLRGAIQIGNPESCRALCAILKTETGLHWSF
jgi:hypothetical protein